MTEKKDIEFISGGMTCRGWMFEAGGTGPAPCVVLAHGFCGTKEMRLDAYAERFAGAGYHALVFDYRHFGDSDGYPRQILDIRKQLEDWRAAISYAGSRKEINSRKIIAWGTSFSGGHVAVMAAEGRNLAAAISQVPHLNGPGTAMAAGFLQGLRLGIASLRDMGCKITGREPFYVPALGKPGELAAMTAPGEFEASRKLMPEGTKEVNELVAARIFLSLPRYSPGKLAGRIKIPWLIQVAEKDRTTPCEPAVKAAKKAAKASFLTYPVGHFEVYVPPWFDRVVADQIAFLKKHVPPSEDKG